jgi:hypothetical protein
MIGNANQIEQATKIKAAKLAELRSEKILSSGTTLAAFFAEMIDMIEAKDQAGYWISRRNMKGFEFIQELVKGDSDLMARYQAAKKAA